MSYKVIIGTILVLGNSEDLFLTQAQTFRFLQNPATFLSIVYNGNEFLKSIFICRVKMEIF